MFKLSITKGIASLVLGERLPITKGKPEEKEFQSQGDIQPDQNNTFSQMVGNGLRLKTADQIRLKINQPPKSESEVAEMAEPKNDGAFRFHQPGGKWRKPPQNLPELALAQVPTEGCSGVEQLKRYGLTLLSEDQRFVIRRLSRFKKSLHSKILTTYTEVWRQAMEAEPLEHKKQNAGRRTANSYLRLLKSGVVDKRTLEGRAHVKTANSHGGTLVFELRNGPALETKRVDKNEGRWVELNIRKDRFVNQNYAAKLDAERLRKRDVIVQMLFDEAEQGRIYTTNQFAEKFEGTAGLGGNRTINDRLSVLASKGFIKFFRNPQDYGLPKLARRLGIFGCSIGHYLAPSIPAILFL